MGMFDFLKKREKAEEKTEIKQEVQIPKPQKSEKILTELPEFPTMMEEKVSPLPKLEPFKDFAKQEIEIPSLEKEYVEKSVSYPEKTITTEFGELKKEVEEQEIEKEIELPPMLKEEVELPTMLKEEAEKEISLPAKIKIPERRTFSSKKPVFVNVKSYQGISDEISIITTIIEESEDIVNRLNNIKTRENNELKKLHDSLDGLNKKIIAVDDILSKG